MAYYSIDKSMSISNIITKWMLGDKAYDEDVHGYFYPEELWGYREYSWTRDKARLNPEEWDELVASMKEFKWDPKKPAIVLIGKNGKAQVGEGNHRLAIAMKLGTKVPVRFDFRQAV